MCVFSSKKYKVLYVFDFVIRERFIKVIVLRLFKQFELFGAIFDFVDKYILQGCERNLICCSLYLIFIINK